MTSPYRYFQIDRDSPTHRALEDMDAVGAAIVAALNELEKTPVTVQRISFNGKHVGFGAFPLDPTSRQVTESKLLVSLWKAYQDVGEEVFRGGLIVTPDFVESSLDGIKVSFDLFDFAKPLDALLLNVAPLSLDPNIALRLKETDPRPADNTSDPARAVLTLQGHSFHMEPRNIFTHWVIRLPAAIDLHGNSYEPPHSRRISETDVKTLIKFDDIDFTEFRGGAGAEARARIAKLQVFQLDLKS